MSPSIASETHPTSSPSMQTLPNLTKSVQGALFFTEAWLVTSQMKLVTWQKQSWEIGLPMLESLHPSSKPTNKPPVHPSLNHAIDHVILHQVPQQSFLDANRAIFSPTKGSSVMSPIIVPLQSSTTGVFFSIQEPRVILASSSSNRGFNSS